jgi:hypothetical protein
MTVNDNIIVQRFFNVRDFNPEAKASIDLYNILYDFKIDIEDQLKVKTTNYMLDNMYDIMHNPNLLETSVIEGPEYFNIYIKQGDTTICHRQVDAKIYPPKIRYTVDVRPYLKSLLNSLTDTFSSQELNFEYADVLLKR